jgi:hypothetical protein
MFLWDVALVDKFFWAMVALALTFLVALEVALRVLFAVRFFWENWVALALTLAVVLEVIFF